MESDSPILPTASISPCILPWTREALRTPALTKATLDSAGMRVPILGGATVSSTTISYKANELVYSMFQTRIEEGLKIIVWSGSSCDGAMIGGEEGTFSHCGFFPLSLLVYSIFNWTMKMWSNGSPRCACRSISLCSYCSILCLIGHLSCSLIRGLGLRLSGHSDDLIERL